MDFEQLAVFRLRKGSHSTPEIGLCAMEAVAWLEGLTHDDHPPCTCPVIAGFVRSANDILDDVERQQLVPYLPRLVGTVSPTHEQERAQYLAWQALTVHTPLALKAAGLHYEAHVLQQLPSDSWKLAEDKASWAKDRARDSGAWLAARYAISTVNALQAAHYHYYPVDAGINSGAAVWSGAWQPTLDGVLAIGPEATGFSQPIDERVSAYRELVDA